MPSSLTTPGGTLPRLLGRPAARQERPALDRAGGRRRAARDQYLRRHHHPADHHSRDRRADLLRLEHYAVRGRLHRRLGAVGQAHRPPRSAPGVPAGAGGVLGGRNRLRPGAVDARAVAGPHGAGSGRRRAVRAELCLDPRHLRRAAVAAGHGAGVRHVGRGHIGRPGDRRRVRAKRPVAAGVLGAGAGGIVAGPDRRQPVPRQDPRRIGVGTGAVADHHAAGAVGAGHLGGQPVAKPGLERRRHRHGHRHRRRHRAHRYPRPRQAAAHRRLYARHPAGPALRHHEPAGGGPDHRDFRAVLPPGDARDDAAGRGLHDRADGGRLDTGLDLQRRPRAGPRLAPDPGQSHRRAGRAGRTGGHHAGRHLASRAAGTCPAWRDADGGGIRHRPGLAAPADPGVLGRRAGRGDAGVVVDHHGAVVCHRPDRGAGRGGRQCRRPHATRRRRRGKAPRWRCSACSPSHPPRPSS